MSFKPLSKDGILFAAPFFAFFFQMVCAFRGITGSKLTNRNTTLHSDSACSSEEASFFVVGDIGMRGEKRQSVARAMADLMRRHGRPDFVLNTGDTVYIQDMTISEDGTWNKVPYDDVYAKNLTNLLQEEVLDFVDIPWYTVMGNHDYTDKVKKRKSNNRTKRMSVKKMILKMRDRTWGKAGRWRILKAESDFIATATKTVYRGSIHQDWSLLNATCPFPSSLLSILAIDTNRYLHGNVAWDWKTQKKWVKRSLKASTSTWNVVFGHHPVHYASVKRKTHFSGGYMKSIVKKLKHAHFYFNGHQHLMAHFIDPKANQTQFVTVGSSSLLDQHDGDFELLGKEGELPDSANPELMQFSEPPYDAKRSPERGGLPGFAHVSVTHDEMRVELIATNPECPVASYRCVYAMVYKNGGGAAQADCMIADVQCIPPKPRRVPREVEFTPRSDLSQQIVEHT